MIVPAVSNNALGILLSGVCLAIPSGTDLSDTIHQTRSKHYPVPPSPGHTNRSSTNSRSYDKKSILGHIREYIGGRAGDYVLGDGGGAPGGAAGGARGLVEIFTSELKAELTRIFPGSIFGLEYYLVRSLAMGLDSIVVSFCNILL